MAAAARGSGSADGAEFAERVDWGVGWGWAGVILSQHAGAEGDGFESAGAGVGQTLAGGGDGCGGLESERGEGGVAWQQGGDLVWIEAELPQAGGSLGQSEDATFAVVHFLDPG